MSRWRPHHVLFVALCLALATGRGMGQSLDERLDEARFLRELSELGLPEIIEHYVATHPKTASADQAAYRIAALRSQMNQPGVPLARRLLLLEQVLEVRAALIAVGGEDRRRAIWLADQASDLYFELLPLDAAGLTTLFGLPSTSQHERASRVAREMNELAAQAEIEIERALLRLEATPGYQEDMALQLERRRLAREERDRRIPFLRGVGAFLHAEINTVDDDERLDLYDLAAEILASLAGDLEGAIAARAQVTGGLALARLGEYDQAESLFRAAATGDESHPDDIFSARMGGVLNRVVTSGPQAGLEGLASIEDRYSDRDSLFYRMLIADRRFLLRRAIAEAGAGQQREQLLADAFESYTALLEADLGVPRETMRGIVFERLTRAAGEGTPLDQLPAIVTVARADHLRGEQATQADSIALYESVLNRTDLPARDQATALFGLGRALYDNEQPLNAARTFARLARDHPTDSRAEQAIELAATIAADVWQKAPAEQDAQSALAETLDLLLARYPNRPTVDRWRFYAGRVALSQGRFDEALRHLEQIPTGDERWLEAQSMQVHVARQRASVVEDAAENRRLNLSVLEVYDRVTPSLRRAIDDTSDADRLAVLKRQFARADLARAESQLELGEAGRAVDTLARFDREEGLPNNLLADALRIRTRAYQAMGDPDRARQELERFVAAAPQRVGEVVAPMLAGLLSECESLLALGDEAGARHKAEQDLVNLAGPLADWLGSAAIDPAAAAALWLQIAESHRMAGRFRDALQIYDDLLRDTPDGVQLLFGRAECFFGLGGDQLAEAFRLFQRLAAAGADRAPQYYWTAQLRLLQILDQTGRNTHQIVPRIERLRLQDSEFGGDRYRRGFNALERKYRG